jgi:hypothetical protein
VTVTGSKEQVKEVALEALDNEVPKGWTLINGKTTSNSPTQLGNGQYQVTARTVIEKRP